MDGDLPEMCIAAQAPGSLVKSNHTAKQGTAGTAAKEGIKEKSKLQDMLSTQMTDPMTDRCARRVQMKVALPDPLGSSRADEAARADVT